jgi:HNH endonuclease
MVSSYIPVELRNRVREYDRNRCCYCLTTEINSGIRMTFDHAFPRANGGETIFENLCLACRSCNEFKSNTTKAIDTVTGQTVEIFNPRIHSWQSHFEWSVDGTEIIGKTEIGRITVTVLQMNNLVIMAARRRWVNVGWHPPAGDL